MNAKEVLHLFREFVVKNATQWQLGAYDHHHPIYALVAEALRDSDGDDLFDDNVSGPKFQFTQPNNRSTLAELGHAEDTHIDCPHCEGTGKVVNDFLTDGHVSDVFSDYCEVFGIHKAYGVHRWDDMGGQILVVHDISARSCFNTDSYYLKREYFTRDRDRRLTLMRADKAAQAAREEKAKRDGKIAELAQLERRAMQLRTELDE